MSVPKSYIPANSNPTIEKFINCLMMQGKKSIARRSFWEAMAVMKTRTKEEPMDVFQKALLNVTPLIEVRPKRVGGAVYQVPTEVTPKRQQSLSMRWLIAAARERKGIPIAQKLALEFLDASNEQGAAFKKKEDVLRMAQANKAFAHLAK
ncbi:30S ribosomal protein S7 [Candidatus Peregrinibacteria bacterium CG10_big_fil_rev_8_21_14_0_10_49_16]|nr:MAG: 30S ribosomal protein S7 [Candidatus Peregrinibacteria bacterium CG22_combo_CG10-13_8_21_14_all_49_11]PIR52385.1 MAG: 30S ribosomal protein S7 [Candidatus Peregrinibacteria bacterium CG10_big_fil_rev_8_21_14_0_10_49_16]